jgi:hypothetical protein
MVNGVAKLREVNGVAKLREVNGVAKLREVNRETLKLDNLLDEKQ